MDINKGYTNLLKQINIADPFPISAPPLVNYWADNREIKKKILKINLEAMVFPNSNIYIFWGPLGGGKTFTSSYIANSEMFAKLGKRVNIEKELVKVITVIAPVPIKTSDVSFSIHKQIVMELLNLIIINPDLLKGLKQRYKKIIVGPIKSAFKDISENIQVSLLENVLSANKVESCEGFRLLIGEKNKLGKISDISELVIITKILLDIILSKNKRIIIQIDELEHLSRATSTERLIFSDYIRRLFDDTENSLTIFLIFTFDSIANVHSLISPALNSRVREIVEFGYIKDEKSLKEYIIESFQHRTSRKITKYISDSVLNKIIKSMLTRYKNRITFRQVNQEMHDHFLKFTPYLVDGKKITDEEYEQDSAKFDRIIDELLKND